MNQLNPTQVVLISQDEDDGFILSDVIAKLPNEVYFTHLPNCTRVEDIVNNHDPFPHIIIIELSSPAKVGIQCLKDIRRSPVLKDVPVAIYSAFINSKVVRECFDAGANFFLPKPNSYSETFQLIKKLFTSDWELFRSDKVFTRDFILNSEVA